MLAGESDSNPYLQQEVMSASPVRLRWMLIRRSIELCDLVAQLWSEERLAEADQWLLRVRDILGELLDGVQDASNPLSKTICDFYIYILQLAHDVGKSRSHNRLQLLKELLEIESETWRQVLEKMKREGQSLATSSHPTVAFSGFFDSLELSEGGTFSLEV